MSKSYKKKIKQEDVTEENTKVLSKKEEYDLNKQKKEQAKKKKVSTKKKSKKIHSKSNLGAKLFALFMLMLMLLSVVTSIFSHFLF